MEVQNAVIPTAKQMEGFLSPDAVEPIFMVNLLKFRERAKYEDGRDSELTGRDAYQSCATGVARLIREVGGQLCFGADVTRLMLGAVEELLDEVAITMYPSRKAMLQMIQMPEYAEISFHRSAGLSGQLNLQTINASGQWLRESAE